MVGDVIKVMSEEYMPADLVLLGTSDQHGSCYVETKNLDGESNLKAKYVPKALLKANNTKEGFVESLKGTEIACELPND